MAARVSRVSTFVAVAVLVAACKGGGPTTPGSTAARPATDYVTGVTSAAGTAAVFQTGAAPVSSGGPSSTVTGTATSLPAGGSSTLQIAASAPFDTIVVSIASNGSAATGFWQLKLPAAATSATIVYVVSANAPGAGSGSFGINVQVASPGGTVGPTSVQQVNPLPPGVDIWHVALGSPGNGLDVSSCGISVAGGFSSQAFTVNASGIFREVWSPMTPVVEVAGTLTATSLSGSFKCVSTSGTGSMSAAGNSTKMSGTATLSGKTIAICATKGSLGSC